MLSKISLLVLGLIAEKPLNPYEIHKYIESINFKKMYPMSTSSVYATINGLLKKGYISGIKAKEGKMPEKTIYSISTEGTEILKNSLQNYLINTENVFSEFDISMIFVCHLPKEDALLALTKRLATLKITIRESEKAVKQMTESQELPYTGLIRRKHHLYKRQAEMKTIKDFISNIKKDQKWNHYPVLEWDINI